LLEGVEAVRVQPIEWRLFASQNAIEIEENKHGSNPMQTISSPLGACFALSLSNLPRCSASYCSINSSSVIAARISDGTFPSRRCRSQRARVLVLMSDSTVIAFNYLESVCRGL